MKLDIICGYWEFDIKNHSSPMKTIFA